ncbi:unnamed protein product [Bemisia tabaci]|uniref:Uncharacterized protein n=1 Tax=Bemisia tabaci TaxID=7038 RepID=A0A9P0F4A1_BEMTA|nr:unnamed protein product [Bemisia tabaci]
MFAEYLAPIPLVQDPNHSPIPGDIFLVPHPMVKMNRYFEAYPRHSGMLTLPPPPLAQEPGATWNSYNSAPLARAVERIKPERSRHDVSVQKLQWKRSQWVDGFPELVSSMTIADVSPRFAVKRILLLYENAQYREAANFINRLSHGTFKTILGQLPIDVFIDAMPHSVSILEALYAKVFLSSDCGIKTLRPESVLMQLVKLFSNTAGSVERWLGQHPEVTQSDRPVRAEVEESAAGEAASPGQGRRGSGPARARGDPRRVPDEPPRRAEGGIPAARGHVQGCAGEARGAVPGRLREEVSGGLAGSGPGGGLAPAAAVPPAGRYPGAAHQEQDPP